MEFKRNLSTSSKIGKYVDVSVFNFFFMADCMNAVGLGFMYPVSLLERLIEFFFQMTGWILTVTLVAEFNTLSTQNDTIRVKFEEKHTLLLNFLVNV